MSTASFIVPKGGGYEIPLKRLTGYLSLLDRRKAWRIDVSEQKSKRTNSQNAYLWGVVYPSIIEAGGETLRGWTNDDLHEYFLGEHHGWEVVEGFGKKRLRPIKRSSNLSITEFQAYLEFIERKMASVGIYIPSPQGGFDG